MGRFDVMRLFTRIVERRSFTLAARRALQKTFELIATKGSSRDDVDVLFPELDPDPLSALDGMRDAANQPLVAEPQRVQDDLRAVVAHRAAA